MKRLLIKIMAITGFRFSKDYRHEITLFHSVIYRLIGTVEANIKADELIENLYQQVQQTY